MNALGSDRDDTAIVEHQLAYHPIVWVAGGMAAVASVFTELGTIVGRDVALLVLGPWTAAWWNAAGHLVIADPEQIGVRIKGERGLCVNYGGLLRRECRDAVDLEDRRVGMSGGAFPSSRGGLWLTSCQSDSINMLIYGGSIKW